jgi:hypothetical protein
LTIDKITKTNNTMTNFNDFFQLMSVLSVLAIASERLVESIKKLFPSLSITPVTTSPNPANPSKIDPKKDFKREGWVSFIAIICGIATSAMAYWAKVPEIKWSADTVNIIGQILLYGLLISGGSRLWNPLMEWLKAFKDQKQKNLKSTNQ